MNDLRAFEAMDLLDDRFLDEALKPRRAARTRRAFVLAASVAAFVCLALFGVVNLFPSAAVAWNDIPVLGDIARAIILDGSMRACLNNDYAQYVGMRDDGDAYQSEVYYMVVDASRISIFFARTRLNGKRTIKVSPLRSTTCGTETENGCPPAAARMRRT